MGTHPTRLSSTAEMEQGGLEGNHIIDKFDIVLENIIT